VHVSAAVVLQVSADPEPPVHVSVGGQSESTLQAVAVVTEQVPARQSASAEQEVAVVTEQFPKAPGQSVSSLQAVAVVTEQFPAVHSLLSAHTT
jgi:hypothetical protein